MVINWESPHVLGRRVNPRSAVQLHAPKRLGACSRSSWNARIDRQFRNRVGLGMLTLGAPAADDGGGRATLLVIAHPDDESMFFAPALLCLARSLELHVLCLSTGDFDGLGAVRALELPRACACLGVPGSRVRVLDDPLLLDGPRTLWPSDHIARLVEAQLDASKAQRVITFDAHGVSRHANHIAVQSGVQLLAARQPNLRVYELRSTGILRRHLGFCDVLLTMVEYWLHQWLPAALSALCALLVGARRPRSKPRTEASARMLVCVSLRPWTVHRAMLQHRSQYVWFRRLYVMVSGFVWVNTLLRR